MPKSAQQCKEIREETKNRILRLSALYFARNGFGNTKISDLSKYIGIGQGTIYLYYQSKEDLFNEIRNRLNNDVEVDHIKKLSLLPIPAKKKIELLVEHILRSFEEDELFAAKVTINTQFIMEGEQYDYAKTIYEGELYKYTAKIIKSGQKEGTIIKKDAIMLADLFWSVVYVYALKSQYSKNYKMIEVSELKRLLLIGKEN
ncbi:MAG TPA: TetR/AcrR family transcriptional regulator [Lachnospiraceae bacterium]|nr:TetR/AcrR family transcriptional regulator [Lachnospiraceae bacterium]